MILAMRCKTFVMMASMSLISCFTYWYISSMLPQSHLGTLHRLFKDHAFAEAESYLQSHSSHRWPHAPEIYAIYLAEAQNQWEKAQHILTTTSWSTQDQPIADLLHAYQSYWSDPTWTPQVTHNELLPTDLQGLHYYRLGEYRAAYAIWSQSTKENPAHHAWWSVLSEVHVSSLWLACHQAHCCLELGNPQRAGELLYPRIQPHLHSYSPLEQAGEALIAWCCLEDASLPIEERYPVAHYWLTSTGDLHDFPMIRHRVAERLFDEILATWSPDWDSVLHQHSLGFLAILEQWHEKELLDRAVRSLLYYLESGKEASVVLLMKVKECLPNTYFQDALVHQLNQRLEKSVSHYDFEPLPEIWQWLLAITEPSQHHVAQAIEGFLSRASTSSTPQQEGAKVIEFYQHFFHSPETNERLSRALLHVSMQYWRRAGQEEMAHMFMEMALRITPNPHQLRHVIQSILAGLFVKAEANHLLDRMAMIYDALIAFDLPLPDLLYQRFDVANYLADAAFLYNQERYQAARSHALCVIKLHPDNQQACRMLGLCAYQLGNPSEAFHQLSRLVSPDPIALEAIAWSQSSDKDSMFLTAACHEALP